MARAKNGGGGHRGCGSSVSDANYPHPPTSRWPEAPWRGGGKAWLQWLCPVWPLLCQVSRALAAKVPPTQRPSTVFVEPGGGGGGQSVGDEVQRLASGVRPVGCDQEGLLSWIWDAAGRR